MINQACIYQQSDFSRVENGDNDINKPSFHLVLFQSEYLADFGLCKSQNCAGPVQLVPYHLAFTGVYAAPLLRLLFLGLLRANNTSQAIFLRISDKSELFISCLFREGKNHSFLNLNNQDIKGERSFKYILYSYI